MTWYVIGFVVLFLLSGIGNGAVYKMIPSIFEAASRSLAADEKTRADYSRSMSGAVIGITGAIGGLGGVVINLMLRASYLTNGTATVAFWDFAALSAATGVQLILSSLYGQDSKIFPCLRFRLAWTPGMRSATPGLDLVEDAISDGFSAIGWDESMARPCGILGISHGLRGLPG